MNKLIIHFYLIDFSQFGCLKGTSTIYCLLDMMHNWLSSIDKPGMFLRACFLDFSKAFDHIDHTILVNKLIHLGVRGFIIRWICSFLYGRRQAVKDNLILTTELTIQIATVKIFQADVSSVSTSSERRTKG